MKIAIEPLVLKFKRPAGTSRGFMTEKRSWLINLEKDGTKGLGEISIIEGLSKEFVNKNDFEKKIKAFCDLVLNIWESEDDLERLLQKLPHIEELKDFPSILFGFESAILDLRNGGKRIYFDNDFSRGLQKIPINGLIWMGDRDFMEEQINEKLQQGFTTLKMKIGAIAIETELSILTSIRSKYTVDELTLRVDANGAFNYSEAKALLQRLSGLEIHSIEQPIPAGLTIEMAELCTSTPLPIALDEELIGISDLQLKKELLDKIRPQFIILKPSLHGGITGTKEWIKLAEELNIGWWMTSALESNIGLNVICQLAAEYENPLPQGLGTGSLYTNNTPTELAVEKGTIFIKKGAAAP
jgi:o-succinylbenzoate synthase